MPIDKKQPPFPSPLQIQGVAHAKGEELYDHSAGHETMGKIELVNRYSTPESHLHPPTHPQRG